jgi:hypothetical protein
MLGRGGLPSPRFPSPLAAGRPHSSHSTAHTLSPPPLQAGTLSKLICNQMASPGQRIYTQMQVGAGRPRRCWSCSGRR